VAAKKAVTKRIVGKLAAPAAKPKRAAAAKPHKKVPPGELLDRLHAIHPDAHCELDHANAFQLLCATVLSAQTTDVNVNKATPKLFARYPDAKTLAKAEALDVEPLVATLGFFRQKAKSLVGLARALVEKHGGEVPRSMDALVKLPGVGRKTASVVLNELRIEPAIAVDTHVFRVAHRLNLSAGKTPDQVEADLMAVVPEPYLTRAHHWLILHGRYTCVARRPKCDECAVADLCPSRKLFVGV
jgi:endonuclease-3